MKKIFNKIYQATIGRIKREIQYRKRIKELRKRDPFIYK
jgi:hypothetical protein